MHICIICICIPLGLTTVSLNFATLILYADRDRYKRLRMPFFFKKKKPSEDSKKKLEYQLCLVMRCTISP